MLIWVRFRYAQCQIEFLCTQKTGKAVKIALEQMPEDLNGIYEEMLSRISPYDQNLAKEALLWLSYVLWPLTLAELCEAIAVEESDRSIGEECRFYRSEIIVDICQGLIVHDENTSIVTLAHSSVRAFLTSGRIAQGPVAFYQLDDAAATRIIFRKCLTYLMFVDFQLACDDQTELCKRMDEFPLLTYAAQSWASHAGDMAPSTFALTTAEIDAIIAFFGTRKMKRGGNFTAWVQCLLNETPVQIAKTTEPLYYAASYGLLPA